MKVLLDTCVLSELYKTEPLEAVRDIVSNLPDNDLYISVVTIGEISKGIALLPESRRKRDLSIWLAQIQQVYANRVLVIDAETATI